MSWTWTQVICDLRKWWTNQAINTHSTGVHSMWAMWCIVTIHYTIYLFFFLNFIEITQNYMSFNSMNCSTLQCGIVHHNELHKNTFCLTFFSAHHCTMLVWAKTIYLEIRITIGDEGGALEHTFVAQKCDTRAALPVKPRPACGKVSGFFPLGVPPTPIPKGWQIQPPSGYAVLCSIFTCLNQRRVKCPPWTTLHFFPLLKTSTTTLLLTTSTTKHFLLTFTTSAQTLPLLFLLLLFLLLPLSHSDGSIK